MAFSNTLSAILRGSWLIDPNWVHSQLPLITEMIKGNFSVVESSESTQTGTYESRPYAIHPGSMYHYPLFTNDGGDRVLNKSIPLGSVGIIPIVGPITKYNGDCGEPGSITRADWLHTMGKMDSISAIVQVLDTPGGETPAFHGYVSAVTKCKKPVLSLIDGLCGSLGVAYAAASKEVYLSDKLDEMGSIGAFCTILDLKEYFLNQGVKVHEIYAPQSTDKNKDYRDAIDGDTSAIKADLKIQVDDFIKYVRENRGEKASLNEKYWNTGKMFYAAEAISLGLADGIKPISQVVGKAAWLATR